MAEQSSSVDEYIAAQPADVQAVLQEVRRRIHAALPGAGEKTSYGMPTITLNDRYVVYFAGWKHHISVYPVPHGDERLAAEMLPYLSGKGTLKFPLAKPVPYDLISRIAAQLAAEKRIEP